MLPAYTAPTEIKVPSEEARVRQPGPFTDQSSRMKPLSCRDMEGNLTAPDIFRFRHERQESQVQERLIDHTSSIPLAVNDRGDVIELRDYTPNIQLGSYYTWRHVVDTANWPLE